MTFFGERKRYEPGDIVVVTFDPTKKYRVIEERDGGGGVLAYRVGRGFSRRNSTVLLVRERIQKVTK